MFGVVLDTEVTTGEANKGDHILPQADAVAAATGTAIKVVTADQGLCVWQGVWRAGEARHRPGDPGQEGADPKPHALPRFRYDARHDILKCPKGRILRPQRRVEHGRFFYSRASDCNCCPMRGDCLSMGRVNKAVVVSDNHPALLRARRRKERWSKEDVHLYQRHRPSARLAGRRTRLGRGIGGMPRHSLTRPCRLQLRPSAVLEHPVPAGLPVHSHRGLVRAHHARTPQPGENGKHRPVHGRSAYRSRHLPCLGPEGFRQWVGELS